MVNLMIFFVSEEGFDESGMCGEVLFGVGF